MNYHKRACLKRARERLAEASPEALRYACLELRFCIESICYDKLRLYAKHIPPEVLNTWQPRRVVETLQEYDPHANSSHTLRKWRNGENGNDPEPSFSGKHIALSPSVLNKHYNKLGGFLHVPTPAQEQKQGVPSSEELAGYLSALIEEIEGAANNTFDTNMANVVTFDCDECGQPLIKNVESLEEAPIIVCINSNCRAQYAMRKEGDAFTRQIRSAEFECGECKTANYVRAHHLREDRSLTVPCVQCGTKYIVSKEWTVAEAQEGT